MNPALYGLAAEFSSSENLLAAVHQVRQKGFRRMDAHSPFPIHGLAEALGMHRTSLPLLVLIGGIIGGIGGFFLQYYASVIDYPYNIGGKPFNSWPAFIPVTFELVILGAALTAVLGMLALNGLPMPYHPLFNIDRFELASRDHFFLFIDHRDPLFDPETTKKLLEAIGARAVYEVEP